MRQNDNQNPTGQKGRGPLVFMGRFEAVAQSLQNWYTDHQRRDVQNGTDEQKGGSEGDLQG